MRADRLVSLVLLLRQRGQLTADTLARELEVSTRTVLRDIEALSAAGVPVYAERGRHGGFALLPGFRTELTGLNHDEALALLTAGSGRGELAFGLGSALASAMRKVVDALPESHRATASDAAERLLVDPETDLLSRRLVTEEVPDTTMIEVRRAVLAGHKLRIHYAATGQTPQWRTVDPIGLVTVRDRGYLLATRSGADRTYRLSRVLAAEELPEPAQRPNRVDLDRVWQERCAQFLSNGHSHRAGTGEPGAARGPAGHRGGRPRRRTRRRRLAAAGGDLPRFDDTPYGRCGSSARTRKPWPRSRCAPPCATAPPRLPPATETHPES
ncbi:MAG: WYL domain-containing protein [Nocardioidaceae bacterium]